MIASITGGRFHVPTPTCISTFLAIFADLPITNLRHGASGSIDWSISTLLSYLYPSLTVDPYPVDLSIDGSWPAAGNVRNGRMLTTPTLTDLLFSFPGNNGTADCTRRALRLYVLVYRYSPRHEMWEVV